MQTAELGLQPDTHRVLELAGIWETDQLQRTADELLAITGMTGEMLYEIVCSLRAVGLGLTRWGFEPRAPNDAPSGSDCELLRQRIVEGRSLSEIGKDVGLNGSDIRERLLVKFGLFRKPPAWQERFSIPRRQEKFATRRSTIERQIATILRKQRDGVSLNALIHDAVDRPDVQAKVREVIGTMTAAKLLTITDGIVRATADLRRNTDQSLGRDGGGRRSGRTRR